MKLISYQIREALREGRHMDAATILAQYHGYTIEPPENPINISLLEHDHYAMRVWLHHRGLEWEEGDVYCTIGTGVSGPITSMVIWTPHEDR